MTTHKNPRTEAQKLKDQIQCLRNELQRWYDKILDAKIAYQEEEKKLKDLLDNHQRVYLKNEI